MIRALRIFRVFGTAPSLRRIINPLVASIIPVTSAFVILFVVIGFGNPSQSSLSSDLGAADVLRNEEQEGIRSSRLEEIVKFSGAQGYF